ncbi:hypothetical protein N7532_007895 [Penicillium argentinense]|uniref:Uncharacterized protein n=1 Tax=Penicillium argentinense TaxID=1131581 RepID=A0A9W9EWJ7_9EURO|nr:uncharacterized protein N7532_007895 [Penicillium argentinense]KAJ5089211.1 hypothetical protein N7532_007895 [Penicillium argentinense]
MGDDTLTTAAAKFIAEKQKAHREETAKAEIRKLEESNELVHLKDLLTEYEKQIGQHSDQEEEIQNLRRSVYEELRVARTREHYIKRLEKDHEEIQEQRQDAERREAQLKEELDFMGHRIVTLEKELDRMFEAKLITENITSNLLREEIGKWKQLRDTLLDLQPEKTFWETVEMFDRFMTMTLKLSQNADKVFQEGVVGTEAQRAKHVRFNGQSMAANFYETPIPDQPTTVSNLGQPSSHYDPDLHYSRATGPSNTGYQTVAQFLDASLEPRDLQFHTHMDRQIPTSSESDFWQQIADETWQRAVTLAAGPMEGVETSPPYTIYDRTSSSGPDPEEWKFKLPFTKDDHDCEGWPLGKRLKRDLPISKLDMMNTTKPLLNLLQLQPSSMTTKSPFTHPKLQLRPSVVHKYLKRDDEHALLFRGTKIRGHFPERVSKVARVRSSLSARCVPSWNRGMSLSPLSNISDEKLIEEKLIQIANVRMPAEWPKSPTPEADDRHILVRDRDRNGRPFRRQWRQIRKRPQVVLMPLLGLVLILCVMHLTREYLLYQRFIAFNTTSDRMMHRMRRAQAEFRPPVDRYVQREWRRWLDVDRVALQ